MVICDWRVGGIFFLEETWMAIRCRRGESDGAPREDSRLVGASTLDAISRLDRQSTHAGSLARTTTKEPEAP